MTIADSAGVSGPIDPPDRSLLCSPDKTAAQAPLELKLGDVFDFGGMIFKVINIVSDRDSFMGTYPVECQHADTSFKMYLTRDGRNYEYQKSSVIRVLRNEPDKVQKWHWVYFSIIDMRWQMTDKKLSEAECREDYYGCKIYKVDQTLELV